MRVAASNCSNSGEEVFDAILIEMSCHDVVDVVPLFQDIIEAEKTFAADDQPSLEWLVGSLLSDASHFFASLNHLLQN